MAQRKKSVRSGSRVHIAQGFLAPSALTGIAPSQATLVSRASICLPQASQSPSLLPIANTAVHMPPRCIDTASFGVLHTHTYHKKDAPPLADAGRHTGELA